jgi:hypothetical protein
MSANEAHVKRLTSIASAILLLTALCASAAEPDGISAMAWILGDWIGKGTGEPGQSSSERHARKVLGDRFVRVEGRSEYARQESNPNGEVHVQTDMWGYDRARKILTLRQFDSLGFASTYVLDTDASTSSRWVLNAEQLENVPKGWRARYIYVLTSGEEYEETLELDMDGKGFQPYVTNRFRKAWSPAVSR